jgi:hypothetical protein
MEKRVVYFLTLFVVASVVNARPTEEERVSLWKAKGNTWPPSWQPYPKEYFENREKEIMAIPATNERWENWLQFVGHLMVPTFTEFGFKVITTPTSVRLKLKNALDEGLNRWNNLRNEAQIDAVYTPLPSKFIDLGHLTSEVLDELKPHHEAWAGGIQLRGTSAYGIRLYQNGSTLAMHYDKVKILFKFDYYFIAQHNKK